MHGGEATNGCRNTLRLWERSDGQTACAREYIRPSSFRRMNERPAAAKNRALLLGTLLPGSKVRLLLRSQRIDRNAHSV